MRVLKFTCIFIVLMSCFETVQQQSKVISPEEMQSLLQIDNVQLVDVRTPEEYELGFIADAKNIDFLSPNFLEEVERLDKKKPIIVYCEKGGRSAKCAEKLKEVGFIKIYDLEGGYSKWKYQDN